MRFSWRPTVTLHPVSQRFVLVDTWLVGAVLGLVVIGLIMVASSSIMISIKYYHISFHFLLRQIIYFSFGVILTLIVMRIPNKYWEAWSLKLLFVSLLLLLLVLVPGIGRMVNGSRRWLAMGPIGVQASEIVKVTIILYVAGYLVRQQESIKQSIIGFVKPLLILAVIVLLLLMEPDFGTAVVISATIMAMLFLSGVKFRYYIGLMIFMLGALALIAVSSPYRVMRLLGFLNPWSDQFNTGYQLTQSLIAFGRGGALGVGLGGSIQKLFYLPEAHTDFLFAVLAEELGLLGIMVIMLLYIIMITRGLLIAYAAYQQQHFFAANVGYGLTFWLGMQALINMGVNGGLLPTKGLTLPFLSYGGASIVMNCIAIGLLLRIDYENRWSMLSASAQYN